MLRCPWDPWAQANSCSVSFLLSQCLSLFDLQERRRKNPPITTKNSRISHTSSFMEHGVDGNQCGLFTEKLICPRATSASSMQTSQREAYVWKGSHAGYGNGCPNISLPLCDQDWAERPGYFEGVGLNNFHWLTSSQSQGFGLRSHASRPAMWYIFGKETLFELCASHVQHKVSFCWNIKPKIIFAVLWDEL